MTDYPRIKRPTEPGWYWFRVDEKSMWKMVEAYEVTASQTLWARNRGVSSFVLPVSQMNGEWAGPIPQPGEEQL